MKITVTGGAGFIGRYVVQDAIDHGHDVLVVDRSVGGWRSSGFESIEKSVHDLTPDDCGDAVIHLAGMLGTAELFERPFEAVAENVGGALAVIMAATEADSHLVTITMPRVWRNVYQATKACAEQLADAWMEHRGLQVTHVRAFNAYGPGQKLGPVRKAVPTFSRAAWEGQPLEIWGDGTSLTDQVYVGDLARVLVAAAEKAPGESEVIEAGTGDPMTVNDLAARIVNEVEGLDLPADVLLGLGRIVHRPMRDGETPHTAGTVSHGIGLEHVGMVPEDIPFRGDRLRETIRSYKP